MARSGSFTDSSGPASGAFGVGTVTQTSTPGGWQHVIQPGRVLFRSWGDPKLNVTVDLSGETPVPQLDTGWEVVDRPKRKGLVEWVGRDPVRLALSVMFDGFHDRDAARVERGIRVLEKLSGHDGGHPPKILMDSAGLIPHDYTNAPHLKWVIETIDWGDAERNRRGKRLRQFADLVLLEFVEDAELVGLPAVQKTKSEGSRAWVDVKQGDTLQKIATRYHLTKAEVVEAKKLNKIRDASKVLTVARIKLPPRSGDVRQGASTKSGIFGVGTISG